MKNSLKFLLISFLIIQSCVSKKEVLYFQDLSKLNGSKIELSEYFLSEGDILKIDISALVNEAALPYNKPTNAIGNTIELMMLNGYIVSNNKNITFPVLGEISVKNMSVNDLGLEIKNLLVEGGHLTNPTVSVRLLNAKVTILGEVNSPGTFNFTENTLSIVQALGLAGDLNIYGNRKNISLIRNNDGIISAVSLDLTKSNLLNGDYAYIKPNDVIVVNPNNAKVSTSGYVGNASIVLSIASTILSSILIISNLN